MECLPTEVFLSLYLSLFIHLWMLSPQTRHVIAIRREDG